MLRGGGAVEVVDFLDSPGLAQLFACLGIRDQGMKARYISELRGVSTGTRLATKPLDIRSVQGAPEGNFD
jgi:hypothetical protein